MRKWNHPLTSRAAKALGEAEKTAARLGLHYTGTEHILAGILKTECMACELLQGFGVTYEKVIGLIEKLIAPEGISRVSSEPALSPKAQRILEDAYAIAKKAGQTAIGTDHILLALIRNEDCVAVRLFNTMELRYEALLTALFDAMGEDAAALRAEYENTQEKSASLIDRFSRDMTAQAAAGRLDPLIGRETEMNRIMQILARRTKNNPCLIGEPGVGKTAIVEGLAARMASGNVPANLKGKRLLAIDLPGMVAGTKYRGEFEERIKKVIEEAGNDSGILLFMDELHTLIGAGGAEGSLDAANILKPALSRGQIQMIGATTVDEYRKHIEKDAALERRFQPVMVNEPSVAETAEILSGVRYAYEEHHGVKIEDAAVQAAAELSARYISDRFLPDKALDLMDEAAARAQMGSLRKAEEGQAAAVKEVTAQIEEAIISGETHLIPALMKKKKALEKKAGSKAGRHASLTVTEDTVAEVVADWTGVPVKKLKEADAVRLKNLEKELHKRVIGQDEAVTAVARAVRRGRVGLSDPRKPVGSFLFLGPTGVGKTELSKALSECVYGNEAAMIRVDMSEYMEKHSVSRLLGSPPGYVGYEEGGQLAEKVRRKPWSVILFDEIEKAHPDVFNVLLQILDDGRVTDSKGRTVDFKNTILIMTSNAGAERIQSPKKLGFGAGEDEKADHERMKSGVMEEVKRIFRPEFLNRIDETIVFRSLNKEDMKKILNVQMKSINKNLMDSHALKLTLTAQAKAALAEKGYDPKYGARPLRRLLQREIEDRLADGLLSGEIHDSDQLSMSYRDGKFVIRVK